MQISGGGWDTTLQELKKIIPNRWRQKTENEIAAPEASKIKIKYKDFNRKWKIAQAESLRRKDFYRTIHFRKLEPLYEHRQYLDWDRSSTEKLAE